MCHQSCIDFGKKHLTRRDIHAKNVIEVGAFEVNGSLRSFVESLNPQSYIGVDIINGPGVDEICDVNDLIWRYGKASFDLVITTELMEHVQNWRNAIHNLKTILRPNGIILLTTRSKGFHYHGFPCDFWRYEVDDMQVLFNDMQIIINGKDKTHPGVFVKAQKPLLFFEKNLEYYNLYSIIRGKRCKNIGEFYIRFFKVKRILRLLLLNLLPSSVINIIKRLFFKPI